MIVHLVSYLILCILDRASHWNFRHHKKQVTGVFRHYKSQPLDFSTSQKLVTGLFQQKLEYSAVLTRGLSYLYIYYFCTAVFSSNHRLKDILGNKNSIYLWFLILTLRRCKITKSVLWDVSEGLCPMLGITLSLPVLQRMEACICEPLWSKN